MLRPEMICEIYAYRAKNNKQQLWLLKEKSSDEPTEKKSFRFSGKTISSLTLADCLGSL